MAASRPMEYRVVSWLGRNWWARSLMGAAVLWVGVYVDWTVVECVGWLMLFNAAIVPPK